MTSWVGRTAVEIAAAVREKRVTPREVVAEHLARIERLDERIGAFRVVRGRPRSRRPTRWAREPIWPNSPWRACRWP